MIWMETETGSMWEPKPKKEKLIVFFEHLDYHQENLYRNLLKSNTDDAIDIHMVVPINEYFMKSKDHRIYSDVLSYCSRIGADFLFLPFFTYPEYFLQELKVRPGLKTMISVGTALSQWHKDSTRANTFYELLEDKRFLSMLIYTLDADRMAIPLFADQIRHHPKIRPWYEFSQEKEEDYFLPRAKKSDYGFNEKDFVVLMFGSMFYGKGIDIFVKSLDHVKTDAKFIVSSRKESVNFDFDPEIFRNRDNLHFIDYMVSDEEKLELFSICDAAVFPYRTTYEYGSSAVFAQCMIAKKLVIVPNFYPFNKAVKKDKLGLVFETENPRSLAEKVDEMYKNFDVLKIQAGFDKYNKRCQTWEQMLKEVTR